MTEIAQESAIHSGSHPEMGLYTWLGDYVERLEGKEARQEFYEHYYSCEGYLKAA